MHGCMIVINYETAGSILMELGWWFRFVLGQFEAGQTFTKCADVVCKTIM